MTGLARDSGRPSSRCPLDRQIGLGKSPVGEMIEEGLDIGLPPVLVIEIRLPPAAIKSPLIDADLAGSLSRALSTGGCSGQLVHASTGSLFLTRNSLLCASPIPCSVRGCCGATTPVDVAGARVLRFSTGSGRREFPAIFLVSRELPWRKVRSGLRPPPASPPTLSPGAKASKGWPDLRAVSRMKPPPSAAQIDPNFGRSGRFQREFSGP